MNPATTHKPEPGDRCLQLRAGLLGGLVVAVFSLLSWRLIYLQCDQHEHHLKELHSNLQEEQVLAASRGSILDTHGVALAEDVPVVELSIELRDLGTGSWLAKAISKLEQMKAGDLEHAYSLEELQSRYLQHLANVTAPRLGMPPADFIQLLQGRLEDRKKKGRALRGEVQLTKTLDFASGLELREALEKAGLGTYKPKSGKLGALLFQEAYVRKYAEHPVSHVVGFYGELKEKPGEKRGVAGLERFYDKRLEGQEGFREMEVDGWDNEIPAYRGMVKLPVHGESLKITLDHRLQRLVEEELDEYDPAGTGVYVRDLKAERVIVVLFDPATMGVRAIGCRDSTHPDGRMMLQNPVAEWQFEPGSIMKVVTMATALSSGKVTPGTRISLGSGGVWDDSDIEAIHDEHAASSLTVEEILVHSSNIGAYKLARMVGTRRFEESLLDFGFYRRSGFESTLELRGDLARPMNLQNLSRMSFGNSICVTPAQMCSALGVILNEGLYRPLHMTQAWLDEEGHEIAGTAATEPRRVISAGAAESVRKAMVEVVERGTGKNARSEFWPVGGKTGTARKATTVVRDGKARTLYQPGDVICSFLGFLPAERPRLGGLVIVDLPRGTRYPHYGGHTAAPLFRRIAEKAMQYYDEPPRFAVDGKGSPRPRDGRTLPASLPLPDSR